VQWQAVRGNESFVQKLRHRVEGLHKIEPNEVMKKVAKKYQLNVEASGRTRRARSARAQCGKVDDLGDRRDFWGTPSRNGFTELG